MKQGRRVRKLIHVIDYQPNSAFAPEPSQWLKAEEVLPQRTMLRTSSKYLNNLIEQDHRRVKQRVYPMLGFKSFANATVTISGVELVHRIRKGQFDTSSLNQSGVREPQIREFV